MGIEKHQNWLYDGVTGIPLPSGDLYFIEDKIRDFMYLLDQSGRIGGAIAKGIESVPCLLYGGVVTKGAGDTLNITEALGLTNYSVDIVGDFLSTPPSHVATDMIRWVKATAQTNMAIASATLNGAATNYIKLAYAEVDGNTRDRQYDSGNYAYERVPSFTITCDTTAATTYEIILATLVGTTGSFTITPYHATENTFWGKNTLAKNTTGSYNTAMGYAALYSNQAGGGNTAIGDSSLYFNTDGINNVAIGYGSLYSNTTGQENISIGYKALYSNTIGNYNTAIGFRSLYANTTGINNTAMGHTSLYANTTGTQNTAIGQSSLYSNVSGSENTAVGYEALYTNTGGFNTAIGGSSLKRNTTGIENTAVGNFALYNNTTGVCNTAVGYTALYLNTTGDHNTAVGSDAGSSITTGTYNTCLGYNAQPTGATAVGEFTLGNANVTNLRCNDTTISALSDERDKAKITNIELGLDFIMALKPRKFKWDKREWYKDGKRDGSKMINEWSVGFVAQELQEVQKQFNADYLNCVNGTPDKLEAAPARVFIPLIKAIQELAEKVKYLEDKR